MLHTTLFFVFLSIFYADCASIEGVATQAICETKECYQAAEQIKKWMNPAFKPCEDFYEFTCGYWHSPDNNTENMQHKTSLGARGDFVTVHLKTFLVDDEIDKESKLFGMLRHFMNMCLDEESLGALGAAPALEFLNEIGGWPLLYPDWNDDGWSLQNTEIYFGGVFFELDVQPHNYTWSFFIYPKHTALEFPYELSEGFDNESVQKYYKEKCDLAEALGADRSLAEKDLKDVVLFEIAMAQLNGSEIGELVMYNLTSLQADIPWVNWTKLLTAVLPTSYGLAPNETVLVLRPTYLRNLGSLIERQPKRTVENYMRSMIAKSLTKYLSAEFYNLTGEFVLDRFDICAQYAQTSSLSGIVASYLARQTKEDTRVATDMTQHILNELVLAVKELEWLDEKTRSEVIKTLKGTKYLISFPDELLDTDKVEELYKEVKINTKSFFGAMLDSEKWVRKEKFKKLGTSLTETNLKDKIKSAMSSTAYFRNKPDTVVVTAGFLHMIPLFSSNVPSYINYGNLGGVIAHELTHALDFTADNDENQLGENKLKQTSYEWGSNKTEEIYDEKKQCVINQYSSFNDSKYTGQKLKGNFTSREDIADIYSMKLALNAYKRLVSLSSPEPALPTLQDYSNEQLLMISVANTNCEIPSKEKRMSQLEEDSHSMFEFRVKGMVMNSPEFGRIFGCESNEPMNPKNKCEVW